MVNALANLGYNTAMEPGRDIVRKELNRGGGALPWKDPLSFAIKCAELSIQRHDAASRRGNMCFFDRSLVDAVSALAYEQSDLAEQHMQLLSKYRYSDTVFMAPPWAEYFENDSERMHTFEDAVAEYDRLLATYTIAGYSIQMLPRASIPDRIEFILQHIS